MRKFFVVGQEDEVNDYDKKDERIAAHEIRHDSTLETNLVLLLSEVAQKMDELNETKDKQPVETLKILSDIVNMVGEFSEGVLKAAPEDGFLSEAVNKASESFSNVKLLHVDQNRISPQTVINLYIGWTGDRNEKNHVFHQIALGIVDILESYFSLITEKFNTPHVANDWKDTFTVCLKELTESVESVSF